VKVQAVVSLKAEHPLGVLLAVAGLARSTFFYQQGRLALPDPQAELKAAIHDAFHAAKGRYGHRRVHLELVKAGWQVAKKTVLKLMRQLGLLSHVRRRRRYNSFKGEAGQIAPNLLDRDFDAEKPNEKWVTDVTEFRIGESKVYLSPVMDLFDRSIVSYAWGTSPSLQLTNTPLQDALSTLRPGEHPMVHSDQGFQYQHVSWRNLIAGVGAKQSMSRKGTCLDNAVIEGFFGHLKEELFNHTRHPSVEAFTAELDDYMHWYNNVRTHTRLEGLSPVEYRAQALAA
jgi:putative transposase